MSLPTTAGMQFSRLKWHRNVLDNAYLHNEPKKEALFHEKRDNVRCAGMRTPVGLPASVRTRRAFHRV